MIEAGLKLTGDTLLFHFEGDEQMLEAVEATFKQFSAFLDLLHDKG